MLLGGMKEGTGIGLLSDALTGTFSPNLKDAIDRAIESGKGAPHGGRRSATGTKAMGNSLLNGKHLRLSDSCRQTTID
jgi:hypothetical protein